MRVAATILILLLASTASADKVHKLADGYELVVGDRKIDVRKGKRRVQLITRDSGFEPAIATDAKARKVTITRDEECTTDLVDTFTFDQLEARLVNAESLVLHRKKDWANAAKGFEAATKLDPSYKLAAFNLASAKSQLKDLTGAVAALKSLLASEPIATYVQVSIDPELQPLLAQPELAALRASKPGTSKVTVNGVDKGVAYSAERKLVVVTLEDTGPMFCGGSRTLELFDTTTGKRAAQLAVARVGDRRCKEKDKLAAAKRDEVASKLLADLGFAPVVTFEDASAEDKGDSGKRVVRLPKAKLGVVTRADGGVNVLSGNKQIASGSLTHDLSSAMHIPEAKVLLVRSYRPSDMCSASAYDAIPLP